MIFPRIRCAGSGGLDSQPATSMLAAWWAVTLRSNSISYIPGMKDPFSLVEHLLQLRAAKRTGWCKFSFGFRSLGGI